MIKKFCPIVLIWFLCPMFTFASGSLEQIVEDYELEEYTYQELENIISMGIEADNYGYTAYGFEDVLCSIPKNDDTTEVQQLRDRISDLEYQVEVLESDLANNENAEYETEFDMDNKENIESTHEVQVDKSEKMVFPFVVGCICGGGIIYIINRIRH